MKDIVDENKTILIIEFNNKGGKPIAQRHKEDINRSGCSSKKNKELGQEISKDYKGKDLLSYVF